MNIGSSERKSYVTLRGWGRIGNNVKVIEEERIFKIKVYSTLIKSIHFIHFLVSL